jgi:hypothetical protein
VEVDHLQSSYAISIIVVLEADEANHLVGSHVDSFDEDNVVDFRHLGAKRRQIQLEPPKNAISPVKSQLNLAHFEYANSPVLISLPKRLVDAPVADIVSGIIEVFQRAIAN